MKILITGAAGFIGSRLGEMMASRGWDVIGIDNLNNYYDPRLKLARLERCGFDFSDISDTEKAVPCAGSHLEEVEYKRIPEMKEFRSQKFPGFSFLRADITDRAQMETLFSTQEFDAVMNLAAQAGVRYSIENPRSYIHNNVEGFLNLLECARHWPVKRFVYASSSSVYGGNEKVPFSEEDRVDNPVSLYAATKKSNELFASVYSHLYGVPAIGLRFFTVYGPWGRPDMAPMLFATAVREGRPIKVFNHGDMSRDFTYIDDIVEGIVKVVECETPPSPGHDVYNIGCGHPESLVEFIEALEMNLGTKAQKEMLPMQPGDVPTTFADTAALSRDFGYAPSTTLDKGIAEFAKWFDNYFTGSTEN